LVGVKESNMPVPTQLPDVERKSLRESAMEQIRAAIFDGTLEPGEHLNDQELQAWLGISRTPIREALNDLAQVGLVEMAAQKYTRVALPTPEDRTKVLQTLGALVGGVVRVTLPTLTDEQRSRAVNVVEGLIASVEARDTFDHGAKVWAMVDQIVEDCPNPFLVRAAQGQIDALAFQLSVTRTEGSTHWDRLEDGYPRLLAAVKSGDAIAAELAIETVFDL